VTRSAALAHLLEMPTRFLVNPGTANWTRALNLAMLAGISASRIEGDVR